MTQPEETKSVSQSALQRKIGGIPVWVYAVAVGLAIFLVIYLRRASAGNSSSNSSTDADPTSDSTIPPFINQVYTNPMPPEASDPKTITKVVTKPVIKENRSYKVQKGDTLESISKKFYNKPGEWRVIYDANKSHFNSIMHNHVDPKRKLHGGHTIVIP